MPRGGRCDAGFVHGTEYRDGSPHPALRGHVLGYGGYREFSATPLRRRRAPGSREFAVTDPEGDVWSVGTYRPTVTT